MSPSWKIGYYDPKALKRLTLTETFIDLIYSSEPCNKRVKCINHLKPWDDLFGGGFIMGEKRSPSLIILHLIQKEYHSLN